MAIWSKNNRACKTLWACARWCKQYSEVFDKAGDLKMKDLLFWKDDMALRKTEAGALADQLGKMFRKLFGAVLEPGVGADAAQKAMVRTMIDGPSTMGDLAETVDANFHFKGE